MDRRAAPFQPVAFRSASQAVGSRNDSGSWSVKVERSSWIALLVRAKYRDKAEMIAAHSTPVGPD